MKMMTLLIHERNFGARSATTTMTMEGAIHMMTVPAIEGSGTLPVRVPLARGTTTMMSSTLYHD